MSELKIKGVPITIGDRDFELIFDLNVVDEIEETFGNVFKMIKAIDTQKGLKQVLAIVINNSIDRINEETAPESGIPKQEHITERWIGRNLQLKDVTPMAAALAKAFRDSMPQSEEDEEIEECDPNSAAGQNPKSL